jgi:hypothetical protein
MAPGASAQDKPVALRFAQGAVFSPGYRDFLDEAFSDYDIFGGFGFLNVEASVQFRPSPFFSLFLNIDGFVNYFSGDKFFLNVIGAPSIGAQLALSSEGGTPYFRVDLNRSFPYTGAEDEEWQSRDLGVNFLGGWRLESGREFELGYIALPARVLDRGDYNFGGFVIRFRL